MVSLLIIKWVFHLFSFYFSSYVKKKSKQKKSTQEGRLFFCNLFFSPRGKEKLCKRVFFTQEEK